LELHVRISTRAVRLAVATTAGIMVGCSSDGTTTDTIGLADYQGQANAICAPAVGAMNSIVQPVIEGTLATMGSEPFSPAELQRFYQALIAPTDQARARIEAMLDALQRLAPPDQDGPDYAQLWDDIAATMAHARADIAAAADDPVAARELWDIDTSPFTPVDARARALGVPSCALDT
jgi:hypothetical protein